MTDGVRLAIFFNTTRAKLANRHNASYKLDAKQMIETKEIRMEGERGKEERMKGRKKKREKERERKVKKKEEEESMLE